MGIRKAAEQVAFAVLITMIIGGLFYLAVSTVSILISIIAPRLDTTQRVTLSKTIVFVLIGLFLVYGLAN